ncbi:hypothetical protein D3C83_219450 [compost metagenome]
MFHGQVEQILRAGGIHKQSFDGIVCVVNGAGGGSQVADVVNRPGNRERLHNVVLDELELAHAG